MIAARFTAAVVVMAAVLAVFSPPTDATYPGKNGDLLISRQVPAVGRPGNTYVTATYDEYGHKVKDLSPPVDGESSNATFEPDGRSFIFGTWYSDGYLGYEAQADLGRGIFSYSPSTQDVNRVWNIPDPLDYYHRLSYSPDGRFILSAQLYVECLSQERDAPCPPVWFAPTNGVYVRNVRANTTRELEFPEPLQPYEAIYSPNGRTIAMAAYRDFNKSNRSDIVIAGAHGANPRRVYSASSALRDLTYSPDGRKVAFLQDSDLYLLNLRNGKVRKLTPDLPVDHPVFSPDGTRIAYTHILPLGPDYDYRTDIRTLDLQTGKSETVVDLDTSDSLMDWGRAYPFRVVTISTPTKTFAAVHAYGPGKVTLRGKGLVPQSRRSQGTEVIRLRVRSKVNPKRTMMGKSTAYVTFAPTGGLPTTKKVKVLLQGGR